VLICDGLFDAQVFPPDLMDKQISLLTPVVLDTTPGLRNEFGAVVTNVKASYKAGNTVEVVFR
jgi:neutral ceramidase